MRVLLKGERYSSCFLYRIKEHIDDVVVVVFIGAYATYCVYLYRLPCFIGLYGVFKNRSAAIGIRLNL